MPAVDPEVRAALDHLAIRSLQARYGDAVTRRAWDELPALFRDDCPVRLDLRGGRVLEHVGGAAVAAFVAESVERFEFFEFALLNAVVDLGPGPGEATGRLYMWELRQDVEARSWSNAYGLYRDRYERGDRGWVFARREYASLARGAAGGPMEVFPVPG